MTVTKAELRAQIAELGLPEPPSSAKLADLVRIVGESRASSPAAPAAHRPRCAAGVPLLTDVCRRCHLDDVDVCPGTV